MLELLAKLGSLLFGTIRLELRTLLDAQLGITREIQERIAYVGRRLNELSGQIDAQRLAAQIVVWGTFETFGERCFTLTLESYNGGYVARFQPQRMFRMSRWLLLGPSELRVRDVIVGQISQTHFSYVSGVAGRMGEGSFDRCEIGNLLQFQIGAN